jgi:hypothetical protein
VVFKPRFYALSGFHTLIWMTVAGVGHLTQQGIVVNGAQNSVTVPISFVTKHHGVQGNAPLGRNAMRFVQKAVLGDFPMVNANPFVIAEVSVQLRG